MHEKAGDVWQVSHIKRPCKQQFA